MGHLFDTHFHLDLHKNRTSVIRDLEEKQIYTIAVTNLPDLYRKESVEIASKYIRFALGFHPELVHLYKTQIPMMWDLLPEVRYVGEVGLDLVDNTYEKEQLAFFNELVERCRYDKKKIFTIHSRRAVTKVLDIIGDNYRFKSILHWFSGSKSELEKALIPAKLYVCLYVTNALAILTRGYDKRAYYVKQSVDTNIAQSLLTVINQIQKGNFGAREISSIKNILGILGRFQDLVIPLTATGDSPLQMEVMQGQDINTQEEFMQRLEQMSVEALDMPYEFVIQGRQSADFAMRLTMSNGKVLRKAYKKQSIIQLFGARIGTKLYNYEYDDNINLELQLPPPTFLNITNTNQLIQNVNETVQAITQMELGQDSDQLLIEVFQRKLMRHYLSTYIDSSNIDRIKKEAEMEYAKLKRGEEE